jgi:hypothetical protein
MSSSDLKTNPKPQHRAYSYKQTSKYSLLVRFITLMPLVVGIVLLMLLVACHQDETIIFVVKVDS